MYKKDKCIGELNKPVLSLPSKKKERKEKRMKEEKERRKKERKEGKKKVKCSLAEGYGSALELVMHDRFNNSGQIKVLPIANTFLIDFAFLCYLFQYLWNQTSKLC